MLKIWIKACLWCLFSFSRAILSIVSSLFSHVVINSCYAWLKLWMNGSSNPPPKTVACSVLSFAIDSNGTCVSGTTAITEFAETSIKYSDRRFLIDLLLLLYTQALITWEDLHFIKKAAIITSYSVGKGSLYCRTSWRAGLVVLTNPPIYRLWAQKR